MAIWRGISFTRASMLLIATSLALPLVLVVLPIPIFMGGLLLAPFGVAQAFSDGTVFGLTLKPAPPYTLPGKTYASRVMAYVAVGLVLLAIAASLARPSTVIWYVIDYIVLSGIKFAFGQATRNALYAARRSRHY